MKLTAVTVQKLRNCVDPQRINIENDVCLIACCVAGIATCGIFN